MLGHGFDARAVDAVLLRGVRKLVDAIVALTTREPAPAAWSPELVVRSGAQDPLAEYQRRAAMEGIPQTRAVDLGQNNLGVSNSCLWLSLAAGVCACPGCLEAVPHVSLQGADVKHAVLAAQRQTAAEWASSRRGDEPVRRLAGLLREAVMQDMERAHNVLSYLPYFALRGVDLGDVGDRRARFARWRSDVRRALSDQLVLQHAALMLEVRVVVVRYSRTEVPETWRVWEVNPEGGGPLVVGNDNRHYVPLLPEEDAWRVGGRRARGAIGSDSE